MNNKAVSYVGKNDNIIDEYFFEYDSIDPSFFLNKDEIVEDLKIRLSEKDLKYIKSFSFDKLICLHSSFGMWIRNTYGLWHKNNPHVVHDLSSSVLHPDQYSFSVIEKLHCQLNSRESFVTSYNKAMKILK